MKKYRIVTAGGDFFAQFLGVYADRLHWYTIEASHFNPKKVSVSVFPGKTHTLDECHDLIKQHREQESDTVFEVVAEFDN